MARALVVFACAFGLRAMLIAPASGAASSCTVDGVIDGHTFACADGVHTRMHPHGFDGDHSGLGCES
jgi:hypothetical protein